MPRKKLRRFSEIQKIDNVIEPSKSIFGEIQNTKEKWQEEIFRNENNLVLELGCGGGEYTVNLAKIKSEEGEKLNFIGIDIKGERLWKGSTLAKKLNLNNVAFLRTKIESLQGFFEKNSVEEIWITFPDPRPKDGEAKKRLTSPRFLEIYKNILKKNGFINLKTDNTDLFKYSLETLENQEGLKTLEYTFDLYGSDFLENKTEKEVEILNIKTTFEKRFLDREIKIKYLKARSF
jgi:tRNA (guanine-N7-)-methyltransferase